MVVALQASYMNAVLICVPSSSVSYMQYVEVPSEWHIGYQTSILVIM